MYSANNRKRKSSDEALQKKAERERKEREQTENMKKQRHEQRFSQINKQSLFDEKEIHNPLILYQKQGDNLAVIVDERLSNELQEHQREGVQKMYNVVSEYGALAKSLKSGFILADKQGLGKTIQTLTVLWTLLTQSPVWDETKKKVSPEIRKAIIVAPKSVVPVWKNQVIKWLSPTGRSNATNWTMDVETLDDRKTTAKKREAANEFMQPNNAKQLLILSYDSFVILSKGADDPLKQNADNIVDLIVLDEAHVIKNDDTQRFAAISNFKVDRKLVLTGTPLQNNLVEYHTLIDYVQPKRLPAKARFECQYQMPIMQYVENKNYVEGKKMLRKLKKKVGSFFLRRTMNPFVKSKKIDYIVCCKMNENPDERLQLELHNAFVEAYRSDVFVDGEMVKKSARTINAFVASHFLKDVCGHPQMVLKRCDDWATEGDPHLKHLINIFDRFNFVDSDTDLELLFSPKLRVLKNLLTNIHHLGQNDRVVIVSYYTHVLDLIEIMCRKERFNFVRFDGKTSGTKREKLINDFNDGHKKDQFIMTLSSRAGGCGISLTGANHLIMFDPDWNPANDDQVMSRIYRDGQQKDCHIYRLLTTASIEEQIFRRQIVKKLLAGAVLNENDDDGIFNFNSTQLHQKEVGKLPIPYMDEMTDESKVHELCVKITSDDLQTCLTHIDMDCRRCDVENRKQLIKPSEMTETMQHDDELELKLWNHHFDRASLPERECEALFDSWVNDDISFVFRKKNEKDVDEDVDETYDEEDLFDDE